MKKLLLIVAMVASFAIARAEQFDELNLLGGWELQSCVGDYPYFTNYYRDYEECSPNDCKYLYLGPIYIDPDDTDKILTPLPFFPNNIADLDNFACNGLFYKEPSKWDDPSFDIDYDGVAVWDFFISNGNKLHLIGIEEFCPSLQFVILSLTDKEMKLRSYDGKCTIVYKKIANGTGISKINEDDESSSVFYNLNGVRHQTPQSGINIERKGNKSRKIAVK